MKAAFTIWNQRIAPVFDVARTIFTVSVASGEIEDMNQDMLLNGPPMRRVAHLKQTGIDILICGAISQPLQHLLIANGIQVIAFVAGEFNEVCQAWLDGTLENAFAMPGCGASSGRQRNGAGEKGTIMKGQRRGAEGAGAGDGQGQGPRRVGRKGGTAAGPSGECVCPRCGNREAHERGVPCTQKKCAKCGAAMVRQ
jgi:predicted Fe-Mo cluster-binding NifX family protein